MIDRFKEIKNKVFKNQSNMSSNLHLSRQALNNIERGISFPSYNTLYVLCNDYNINLNYLLTGQGNMLLSDDDKVNNDELIQQQQDRIKELQAQVNLLKELPQSNNKQS